MIERPILFSCPMVRAIFVGHKTQTRRVVKGVRQDNTVKVGPRTVRHVLDAALPCPYGQPGDRLWVRETFASAAAGLVAYQADGECGAWMNDGGGGRIWNRHGGVFWEGGPARADSWRGQAFGLDAFGGRWHPSIHMPRWASRLTLEITGVRVERVREISEDDAWAEGVLGDSAMARESFRTLWDSLNAARGHGWDTNPWVWVIEFRTVANG